MSAHDILMSAAGGGTSLAANYVEDVFSTYLYTGNGTTQTITNGIDLSTKGGLVWIKGRNQAWNNYFYDTARGVNKWVASNNTGAQSTDVGNLGVSAFNTSGFSLGDSNGVNNLSLASTYASWTFREQPKFFDVVTYTGDGIAGRTVAHNLGSVPGCIIVKRTDATANWAVYHRGVNAGVNPENYTVYLNLTNAQAGGRWNNTAPTGTQFTVGTDDSVNLNGATYVAYLFAHNAGGFGLTGTDNVISCGSYNTNASGEATVNIGFEPQWILAKASSASSRWYIFDSMRGFLASTGLAGSNSTWLAANLTDAEGNQPFNVTSTGFLDRGTFVASGTVIYIAIRRGPMKVPTDATKVFSPVAQTTTAPTTVTTNFPVDVEWWRNGRSTAGRTTYSFDRLRGGTQQLRLNSTVAEQTDVAPNISYFDSNVAFVENFASAGQDAIFWSFRRAPGFFDEVCYTGTGSAIARNHNLAVLPELIITKARTDVGGQMNWYVGHYGLNQYATSISTAAVNNTSLSTFAPVTTTTFVPLLNNNTGTFVSYLFATCPGVSKVGSYTGTGTTLQINCGFTAGSRFVMIKRADSTGDWYVWDSARGIVAGNDPYLWLNSTAAEVTGTDYIDPVSSGFEISSTAPAAINASGGSYIYLAIA